MERKAVLGMMLTLLLIGMLTLAFNIQPVKASGTIYIRADGSVDPEGTPISSIDNITYTLTDNIVGDVPEWSSAIVVERHGNSNLWFGWVDSYNKANSRTQFRLSPLSFNIRP